MLEGNGPSCCHRVFYAAISAFIFEFFAEKYRSCSLVGSVERGVLRQSAVVVDEGYSLNYGKGVIGKHAEKFVCNRFILELAVVFRKQTLFKQL